VCVCVCVCVNQNGYSTGHNRYMCCRADCNPARTDLLMNSDIEHCSQRFECRQFSRILICAEVCTKFCNTLRNTQVLMPLFGY